MSQISLLDLDRECNSSFDGQIASVFMEAENLLALAGSSGLLSQAIEHVARVNDDC
jgi:hypothetical protein